MNRNSIFRKPSLGIAMARADVGEVVVEKDQPGQPHKGKVFAAIHAHLDDAPYYAGGLCAKLISEGYTGYIIRTSNDEKCGGQTTAENILSNEQEHVKMAKALGFRDSFDFYYQNHEMDGISPLDIRARLIFLFRFLKVDTAVSFNPWGHGEENPDHWVTGRAVEAACWMSGMPNDFHEHLEANIRPHKVLERYYFYGRPGQVYNRVVDIGSHIEKKIDAIVECRSQGGGNWGSQLRARLAKQGKRLPLLGNDDRAADREYVRQFLLDDDREYGKEYKLEFAERFYYIDQRRPRKSKVDEYVENNAVSL
jgi:LmbE family N-acetylglucosaminyl deacetylase